MNNSLAEVHPELVSERSENEMIQNMHYMHYMRDFFMALVLYFRLSGFTIFPRRKSLQLMK